MKKILLTVVVIAVVFISAGAKTHKRNPNSIFGEKVFMPVSHVVRQNKIQPWNPGLVKVGGKQSMLPIKSGSRLIMNTSITNKPNQSNSNASIASVPEKLLGTFSCKGISYFGGYVTGETVITADNETANKIWFSNLIPGASTKLVYGYVSADQKTISIPQGQLIYVESTTTANLSIYGTSDDVVGQFDVSKGLLTITSDLWGAEASDGWVELFSGNVTYTRTDMLPPVASYRQPSGGLFLGLDPDTWGGFSSTCIINSPYVTWNWKNNNIEDDVSYIWSCTDSISNENFWSDQDSLVMDVEDSYYNTPKLLASDTKGFSSTFILGADHINMGNSSYTSAGGDAVWLGFDATNDYGPANLDNGFTLLANGTDSYYFGTGASHFSDADYESLLVYYEKPLSTLYFEGVNVYLYVFDAPDNTPFTMNVVLAEKNDEGFSRKGKVIASSNIKAQDVVPILYDNEVVGYTMKFSDFKALDEDGFQITKESIETDKAFYLELTGFNVPGVKLAACTEEINPSDGDSRSGFMVKGDESIYFWENNRQTMYFNLSGMAYSYISLTENTVYDNKSGGTYDIGAFPFFDTLYFDNQSVPNWLHVEIVDEEYSDTNWGATLRVTVDALASSAEPRYYDLVLNTVGATKTIFINQGGPVSTGEIKKAQSVFASKNGQGFMIKYPGEMNSLSVYSATGAFVGRYNLPETGSYQLNGSTLSSGMYILKLQGSKGFETIKVVKD